MQAILSTIRELRADGLDPDVILGIVVAELEDDERERDRWADRQSEAAERAEYERAHGAAVTF